MLFRSLIENNFIYIAQPPLYRVTRKKSSRYIHSEKEMDSYLLKLGISDINVRMASQDQHLDKDYLENEYINNKKSINQIAIECKVLNKTIYFYMKKFKINL